MLSHTASRLIPTARALTPLISQLAHVQRRSFLTVVEQYERGVMFTLGKVTSVKGPGVRINIPMLQQMYKVDMRTVVQVCYGTSPLCPSAQLKIKNAYNNKYAHTISRISINKK